ncbi:hypothetical protein H6F77_11665 [Microcoleus sp. FACHB-831]|uniref:hypothetical protein n=1 Tax=Microcoleus sp. FACHB-831 TaxID=2692827 RepID=UPI001688EDA5|nr:hypothetical protein [Microcoleus sp. FACHB-831]MBD1921749.1 hypothetical protein [Microcoleus sp. FACHB-831]
MPWEPFFVAPLEQQLYEWEYSGSITSSSQLGRTTSDYFLFRMRGYQLDEPVRTYDNGLTVTRDWFNVYYAIAEFNSYPSSGSAPVVGKAQFYNPVGSDEHSQPTDVELYLPYHRKPGGEENGRFIGVKKLPRKGGKRFFGKIEGFGNPWQFGQVIGTVSSRQNDDDKLLIEVYHWVESDTLPVIESTPIEDDIYSFLTLIPVHFNVIVQQFSSTYTDDAIANTLLELERKGKANKTAGRRGEYWSVAIPY